jgi:hypothetical protein
MSARVEIVVAEIDSCLSVPVQAVGGTAGKPAVFVRGSGGDVSRPVRLGRSNDRFVEILEGVSEGDVVLLAPPREAGGPAHDGSGAGGGRGGGGRGRGRRGAGGGGAGGGASPDAPAAPGAPAEGGGEKPEAGAGGERPSNPVPGGGRPAVAPREPAMDGAAGGNG